VDLLEVIHVIKSAYQLYQFVGCKFDVWQAHLLAEELIAEGVPMSEARLTGEDYDIITRSLLDAFSNRRIKLYPDHRLRHDLLRLKFEETLKGYKLTAIRDDYGHCDRAIAMSYALPAALAAAGRYGVLPPCRDEVLVT
jgi:hypothetical protein